MDLTLYGSPLSPFVRKVEVLLREKGVDYETENVNLPAPDGYEKIHPAKRMPALLDRSVGKEAYLPDSSAICAYLERKHPEPALYPADDFDYGRALWFEEWADGEVAPLSGMNIFRPVVFARFRKKEPDLDRARQTWTERMPPLFDYLEGQLGRSPFLVGDRFSIADIAVVCQLIQLELAIGWPGAERWPAITAFLERVKSRPSFAQNLEISRKIVGAPADLGV